MKILNLPLFAILWLAPFFLTAQVTNNLQLPTSINTDGSAPDASAVLDVQSTTQGILVPRLTTAQRTAIPLPANGLLVFDTDTGGFWFFTNSDWVNLGAVPSSIADADGDTKILTEESPDQDRIRFRVRDEEMMVIDTSGKIGLGTGTPWWDIDMLGSNPDEGTTQQMSNSDRTKFIRLFSGRENDPDPFLNWKSGTDFRFITSDNDFFGFTERMRFTGEGRLGIGTTMPDALLHIEGGALLAQGTTGDTPVSGAGTRLMWIPAKKAFRAGEVTGTQWDDANIGANSFVGGGLGNTASNSYSFVGGGQANTASGISSFVGGGFGNTASNSSSFIGGGSSNTASGFDSFVGGGSENTALGAFSFVGGGFENTASNGSSFVGGGFDNTASGAHSFVGGGTKLLAKSYSETVFGTFNTDYTPVSTTEINAADRLFVIGNGTSTTRSNAVTVLKIGSVGIGTDTPEALLHIEGGALLAQGTTGGTPVSGVGTRMMWIPAKKAFRAGEVNGTQWNDASIGENSFVGGGFGNTALGQHSFVGGGSGNTASNGSSFVGGGFGNTASGFDSFVGGGFDNTALGQRSFVGGGGGNTVSGGFSFVGGGGVNTVSGGYSFAGGGLGNTASGVNSFAGGGTNLLAKSFSEAVFGTYNTDYTPASTTAINAADRLFVIGNGTSSGARSNAVTVLKSGRVGIGTDTPGLRLQVDGGTDVSPTSGGYFQTGSTSGQNIAMDDNEIMARNNGALSPLYLNNEGGDVIINSANASGKVGIGTSAPDGTLHVHKGSAGSVTANIFSVGVFENSDHAYLHLLTPNLKSSGLLFGFPSNPADGSIIYNESPILKGLQFKTNGSTTMVLDQNGNLGLGTGAVVPFERLHIKGNAQLDGPNGNRNSIVGTPTGFPNNGAVVVFDGANVAQAGIQVDAAGLGVVFGDIKAFVMQHPEQPGKNIWYASLEGPEAAAYERGTATLQNGEAFVPFSDHYRLVANPETMTVLLTPAEWDTYGLAVVEKTATGFRVKELKGGTGNFSFDWEVKCVRQGFEDYRVVRDKRELEFGNGEEK